MAKQRSQSLVSQSTSEANKIREIHAETDALFLSIGDGAIVTDSLGRISRVNSVALDILGFKKRELFGKWFPGVIIAEDRNGKVLSNYSRPITQVFLTGQTITRRIYYRRKDNTRVPVVATVSPVLLRGKPTGAIELFRDITDELALEQAKDDFISIASHQLRTPSTGVKQYAGMLLEGYAGKLTRQQRTLLAKAYESNDRQLEIIDDLLKVARVDAGNITLQISEYDIVELINGVLSESAGNIKKRKQTVEFIHPRPKIKVQSDYSRVRMVVDNLIDNAIKYTPSGGKITIRAYQLKTKTVIEIRDRGVGIALEDFGKLFQKFQRIPNDLSVEAGGTGLGLYWAEKIVQLHNGRIVVKSKLGKGSSFKLYLPIEHSEKPTDN